MIKDIWNKFKDACANAWNDCKAGVKASAKESFVILKDGCISFITAIFKWLWTLLKGVCLVAWSLIQVVWAALVAAVICYCWSSL